MPRPDVVPWNVSDVRRTLTPRGLTVFLKVELRWDILEYTLRGDINPEFQMLTKSYKPLKRHGIFHATVQHFIVQGNALCLYNIQLALTSGER